MKTRIIVTGQSGVKINKILNRFLIHDHKSTDITFYNVEKLMIESYRKDFSVSENTSDFQILCKILESPLDFIYHLWRKQFEYICNETEGKAGRFIISLHASLYHHHTVEFVSPISCSLISRFKPDLILTFIDDIYNIHDRLKEEDQLFFPSSGGAVGPEEGVKELLKILEWRSKEIMISRLIAEENHCPHILFATKHSNDVLSNILNTPKPIAYLSHPITEIRRQLRIGKREEAIKFINEIKQLGQACSESLSIISPTSIDEFRIESKSKDVYVAQLTERWDEQSLLEDYAFIAEKISTRNGGHFIWEREYSAEEEQRISVLLKTLVDNIITQISSRDHKLVEQSDLLIVYRPFYNGQPSTGVIKEIYYLLQLNKLKIKLGQIPNKKCFVYMPTTDFLHLVKNNIEDAINKVLNKDKKLGEPHTLFELNDTEAKKIFELLRERSTENIDNIAYNLQKFLGKRSLGIEGLHFAMGGDRTWEAKRFMENLVQKTIENIDKLLKNFQSEDYIFVLSEDDTEGEINPQMFFDMTKSIGYGK